MRVRSLRLLLLLLAAGWCVAEHFLLRSAGQTRRKQTPPKTVAKEDSFKTTVLPFITENCAACHNARTSKGGLNLDAFRSTEDVSKQRERWELIAQKFQSGAMPPKGMPRPDARQIKAVGVWLDSLFAKLDRAVKPDPGRVTARRLNRVEYNNTIRDLLAIDFKPADDFPADAPCVRANEADETAATDGLRLRA